MFKQAKHFGYKKPPLETALLLRLAYSQKELDCDRLWVVHEQVRDAFGYKRNFVLERNSETGSDVLDAEILSTNGKWSRDAFFAFEHREPCCYRSIKG